LPSQRKAAPKGRWLHAGNDGSVDISGTHRGEELADLALEAVAVFDSDCAADSTSVEAVPVSAAPRCTSVMLAETCWVP